MATTHEIQPGRPLDLSKEVVGLFFAGHEAKVVEQPGGPPQRIEGYTVGAPEHTGPSPHNGEMHPDGDELLFVISGSMDVRLELPDGATTVELGPGDGLVVPKGTWHLITSREPGRMLHITPGPRGEHRPLEDRAP